MKKAIITGATGLVGQAVAKYLSNKGIEVLCLGRKQLSTIEIKNKFCSNNIEYLSIKMENILSLKEEINKIGWFAGDSCVFYNFAWGGCNKLTDGDFQDQFNNAIYSSNAVLSAKKLGCSKFINVGTLEETYAEGFMSAAKNTTPYVSSQTDYVISKLAARDMCKMVSYLEKIDYIHTRLSVPLDPQLRMGGYISSVLVKILEDKTYEKPNSTQLFDIISTEDVAKAYYLIGIKGKNKADYFIGTSQPKTLREYFDLFEQSKGGMPDTVGGRNTMKPDNGIFSIVNLVNDTGFVLSSNFEEFIKTFYTS
jgi:nucleoside-diphosphate-sugar epimerase